MRTTKYLVLPFVCVAVLCAWCISYFSYQSGKNIVLQTTEQYFRFVLLEVADNIKQRVTKIVDSAEIAARSSSIEAALSLGGSRQEKAQRHAAARMRLDTINAITEEGSSLALLNAEGRVVIDATGILSALLPDISAEAKPESPLRMVRGGKPYVGVQMHPASKSVIIYALAPVVVNDMYVGAVFTSMNMEGFLHVWALALEKLPDVRLTLLDYQNNVIIGSDSYVNAGMNSLQKYEKDTLLSTLCELATLKSDGMRLGMRWLVPEYNWFLTIGVEKAMLLAPAKNLLHTTIVISIIVSLLTIFAIITVFKTMQNRLRKSDDTLAQMIDAAGVATWEWDAEQQKMRVNRFFNRIFGYDEERASYSQEWCLENMHPDDLQKDGDKTLECVLQYAQNTECRLKDARGQWHWVRSIGSVSVHPQTGKVLGGKGIFVDIQARKEADAARERQQQCLEVLVSERTAALQESNSIILRERALLDSVLNSIPDLIYYKDTTGRYVGCNVACACLFGVAIKDIIGKKDTELNVFCPKTLQEVEQRDAQAYLSLGSYCYEQVVEFNDGRAFFYETVKRVFYNECRGIQGIVCISRNIGERKKAEAELVRARQDASAASQAKSEFLANMSHEIRTPLNGIVGLNYLAMQEDPPPKVLAYLKKIASSAQNLSLIINDILDFSKIEAGKLELDFSAFAMGEIVQSTFDMLQPLADKKGIELRVEQLDTVPSVLMGDPLRLSQIFLNLLSNAVKFTHEGGVFLIFEEQTCTEKRISLKIRVQDTGIGMTAEQISRLFLAFTQADTSTTRKYGGTGLGLTICKSLIDLMGGSISVSSVLGEGSCFSFTLDLGLAASCDSVRLGVDISASPAALVPTPSMEAEQSAGVAQHDLQDIHVLLVEDNDINQIIAQELLQCMGCKVDVAGDGQEAVYKVLHTNYDLVLMDIQMPIMDGFSATREIRNHSRLQDMPIIAMTAHAMMSDREKSLAAGMQDHVTKPIDPATLEHTVRRWVKCSF